MAYNDLQAVFSRQAEGLLPSIFWNRNQYFSSLLVRPWYQSRRAAKGTAALQWASLFTDCTRTTRHRRVSSTQLVHPGGARFDRRPAASGAMFSDPARNTPMLPVDGGSASVSNLPCGTAAMTDLVGNHGRHAALYRYRLASKCFCMASAEFPTAFTAARRSPSEQCRALHQS